MSASQILADIDTVPFDQSTKVQPQLENMTDNVYYGKFLQISLESGYWQLAITSKSLLETASCLQQTFAGDSQLSIAIFVL